MKAVTKILAGGVALAALASAAPAAAQYYPGYGYRNGGNVVGQVLNQVLGGNQYGYGNQQYAYGNGVNSQAAVQRCAAAVEQRINRDYNRTLMAATAPITATAVTTATAVITAAYAQPQGAARVLGVTSVERRSDNGCGSAESRRPMLMPAATAPLMAVAMAGTAAMLRSRATAMPRSRGGELTFKCNIDYRGYIRDIDLDRNNYAYSPTDRGY